MWTVGKLVCPKDLYSGPQSKLVQRDIITEGMRENSVMYLCWQGRARNGVVGVAWQIGQVVSSSVELEDLSFENGQNIFLKVDELRRGRSNNNISCSQEEEEDRVRKVNILRTV